MIENVFTFNGPMACSSAKALVLAHVTRVKKGIVAPLKFPISVFLWDSQNEPTACYASINVRRKKENPYCEIPEVGVEPIVYAQVNKKK